MSQTSPSGTATQPFSNVEVQNLHRDDRRAAAAVIVLMSGIFSIGLVGYSAVCLWIINS
jgi:hypothetical protein